MFIISLFCYRSNPYISLANVQETQKCIYPTVSFSFCFINCPLRLFPRRCLCLSALSGGYVCIMTNVTVSFQKPTIYSWQFQNVTTRRTNIDTASIFWWIKSTFLVCVSEWCPGPGRLIGRKNWKTNFKWIYRHLAELRACFWHLCRWQTLKYQFFPLGGRLRKWSTCDQNKTHNMLSQDKENNVQCGTLIL